MNSLGVVLMLYSGSGISAISSVPYAFSEVIKNISLGTFTYIFQTLLVLVLMILRKKFVWEYLFSFVVGFCFFQGGLKVRVRFYGDLLGGDGEFVIDVGGEDADACAQFDYRVCGT